MSEINPDIVSPKANQLKEIFNPITLIKAAPNSSRFFRQDVSNKIVGAVEQFKSTDEYGQERVDQSQPYNKQRFDETKQVLGVRWNHSKRRRLIIDPNDPTKKKLLTDNSKVLNELVANCRLINQRKDHPKFGEFITETDIYDRNDPFFSHPQCRYGLSAGEAYIPSTLKDPLNVIILLGWLARKDFQLGSATKVGLRGVQVKYIIVDKDIELKEKKDRRQEDDEARRIYKELTAEQKLKIAIALGVITSLKTNEDIVDNYIYEFATDGVTKYKATKKTKQKLFLELIALGKNHINCYYAFYLGKSKGIIRMQNKSYHAFGINLGLSTADCVAKINGDDVLFSNIIEACEVKKTEV